LGFPGERTSALDGNHMEIAKFSSKEDSNYSRVAGNIARIVEKLVVPMTTTSTATKYCPQKQNLLT
jgi:hypothetical protein